MHRHGPGQRGERQNNSSNVYCVGKPQDRFRDAVDNSIHPFVSRLRSKPNALVALDEQAEFSRRGRRVKNLVHPYEYEIETLNFSEDDIKKCEPMRWLPLESTPLHFVDTIDAIKVVVNKLKTCSEFAVDLEGNTRRSFLGMTCILQISTRTEDFIVDTLKLRDDLQILNEVFTDPKIVKVFHGAIADIGALQRDLAVYVVNMFDTYEAAKELNLESLQLRGLVDRYCHVSLSKSVRTSDWRTRPLSDEQISYARQDTHYLLYIYDVMKNELLNVGFAATANVYINSQNACKTLYEKPKPLQSIVLYKRTGKHFDDQQYKVFEALAAWRDRVARDFDESLEYVMPIATLVRLVECSPRTEQEMLDCCSKPYVPNMVKRFKRDITKIINECLA